MEIKKNSFDLELLPVFWEQLDKDAKNGNTTVDDLIGKAVLNKMQREIVELDPLTPTFMGYLYDDDREKRRVTLPASVFVVLRDMENKPERRIAYTISAVVRAYSDYIPKRKEIPQKFGKITNRAAMLLKEEIDDFE